MLRIVVISSLFLAACDVGEIPGATTDGGGGGGDSGGSGNGCVDTVTPAAAPHSHADDQTPKTGQSCMQAGCHLTGGAGPTFSFAGTVYTTPQATAPKPGATVKVEFNGTTVTAVSDEAGNFYSTQTITLPAKTLATACPTVAPMVGMIVTGGGNCNNCHSTQQGAQTLPVYVQ